ASGGRQGCPNVKSGLAEGMARRGDLAGALVLIDEAIAQNERPGWGGGHYYSQALRIRGWVLSLKGDPAKAGRAYMASLEWARRGAAAAGEILGTAHRGELCAADARPRACWRSPCPSRADLRLVHRRLRHRRSERSEGATQRVEVSTAPACPPSGANDRFLET